MCARRLLFFVLIVLVFGGIAPCVHAQGAAPVIQRAALDTDTGVLTIVGTGLGPELTVLVQGVAVPVLPGATSTRVEVQAPPSLLTSPGTYRLTVADLARHVGDAFVVVSQLTRVGLDSTVLGRTAASEPGTVAVARVPPVLGPAPISVGRVRTAVPSSVIEDPTNTAIGLDALASNTIGSFNMAGGRDALTNNTSGFENTAIGALALAANTSSWQNTASGAGALNRNTSGRENTASGARALYVNTTGSRNVADGAFALGANTAGSDNTATGVSALATNTAGSKNAANGAKTLYSNTTGIENTAIGMNALYSNTTGDSNTASGVNALSANTTASYNTATGGNALLFNTTGQYHVATGYAALANNTTGRYNTATGVTALSANTTGTNNVATGAEALYLNTEGNDNTATGTSALYHNTTSFNTAHGTAALYNTTTGGWNVAVGDRAGLNATTGSYNVFLGAGVFGTAGDTNTIRLGLPYNGTLGQNRTFIAGIYGTALNGGAQIVYIDSNGQLGTQPDPPSGGSFLPMNAGQSSNAELQRQLSDQQKHLRDLEAVNRELRERLARLEALVGKTRSAK